MSDGWPREEQPAREPGEEGSEEGSSETEGTVVDGEPVAEGGDDESDGGYVEVENANIRERVEGREGGAEGPGRYHLPPLEVRIKVRWG
jgi:hypothetical protein